MHSGSSTSYFIKIIQLKMMNYYKISSLQITFPQQEPMVYRCHKNMHLRPWQKYHFTRLIILLIMMIMMILIMMIMMIIYLQVTTIYYQYASYYIYWLTWAMCKYWPLLPVTAGDINQVNITDWTSYKVQYYSKFLHNLKVQVFVRTFDNSVCFQM